MYMYFQVYFSSFCHPDIAVDCNSKSLIHQASKYMQGKRWYKYMVLNKINESVFSNTNMFLLCPKIYILTLKVLFVAIILNIIKKNCCRFFI